MQNNQTQKETIESAVSEMRWQLKEVDERVVMAIMQKFDLPEIMSRVIANRGIQIDEVEDYLNPTIRKFLPDPLHLIDMEIAAQRIVKALQQNEKITVFGDYDVDGATSSALLKRFFADLNIPIDIYIPDRITEGYGPTQFAFDRIKASGTKVVITVDCGIVSYEPLKYAKSIGLDVIIIDHHLSTDVMPEAVAVVNPNRLDEKTDHVYLAAVGVSFLFAVAIRGELRKAEWFKDKSEPDLLSLVDLVALGTICDSVPLKPLNRAFVAQGLKLIERRNNPGIAALADVSGINSKLSCYHLGFIIGPRINAGGRVGQSDLGALVLSSDEYITAKNLSMQLNNYNLERRAIESTVLEEAKEQAAAIPPEARLIMVGSKEWHPGVVGIVASRLKDTYNKPIAVLSINEDGVGKASCRSIRGVDFGTAIVAAKAKNLVLDGGGHSMAAGFSVDMSKIEELRLYFEETFKKDFDALAQRHVKEFDAFLDVNAVNMNLGKMLERTAPHGIGNPEPRFVLRDVQILKSFIVGSEHVKCILVSRNVPQGMTIKATAFKVVGQEVGEILLHAPTKKQGFNIFGKISINRWQRNETVDFLIEDISSI